MFMNFKIGKLIYVKFFIRFIRYNCVYRKFPKFFGHKKLCCNSPKIQTKRQNLKVFCQKHANGIANSEDPDQTALVGAV